MSVYSELRAELASEEPAEPAGQDGANTFGFYAATSSAWQMGHGDRGALFMLLELIKPRVVVEIGTHSGGSAFVCADKAEKVYCLDIDPKVKDRVSFRNNIEVIIGDSKRELPVLLSRISGFDLAIVDGDHTAPGVKADIDALLATRPDRPCWVFMHDSFNPECRSGILSADWSKPWVHQLEIDFVIGEIMFDPPLEHSMWGGVAVAELRPTDRTGPLTIRKTAEPLFQLAYRNSVHRPPPL